MRLAFMGTPEFSVPVLGELCAAGHEIAAVYTRAPRPSGRGKKLTPSPVHQFAQSQNIEVRTPKNFKDQKDIDAFAALNLDVAIVVAYGLILPRAILDAPRHGCLNLHASLLPRWRGAAPIQRAIMAGDDVTGVQLMRMEAGLDTGPVLLSETADIHKNETAGTLHDRLSQIAAQLAPRGLAALECDALIETPQREEGAIYADKITPAEARIDWSKTAQEVDCHIRGLSPFPGGWFEHDGCRVKVLLSRVADGAGAPGTVLQAENGLIVACRGGAVALLSLQRSGKRAQDAHEFLRGFSISSGDRL